MLWSQYCGALYEHRVAYEQPHVHLEGRHLACVRFEISQESSQHKSWYYCPFAQTVRPINVEELEGRKTTVLHPFSLSQKHNPDPPAEVSAATAETVPMALMSSWSYSLPSFSPKTAVCMLPQLLCTLSRILSPTSSVSS